MSNNKTICLCSIVKNEESTIARLIESCKGIIDYWVIIDTGSTDKTKEIIEKELKGIPGKLLDKDWVNFGHNRTELVKLAKGKADYLLLMDADMIVETDRRFNKNNLIADMYQIRYTGSIDYAQPLLVSGSVDWFYKGYTHEYLTSKEVYNQGVLPDMKINHREDGGMRGDKYERDIKLLEEEIKDFPTIARPYFYLGQTYQFSGMYKESIEAFKKRIEMGGWNEEIYYSLYQIGMNLYLLKDRESAVLQFMEAYDCRPSRFEALYMLGKLHREMKKYATARVFLERVLKQPYPHNDILFINRTHYSFLADFELGICNYWLGDYKTAKKHCLKLFNRSDVPKYLIKQNEDNYRFVDEKLTKQKEKRNDLFFVSMYTYGTPYEEESKTLFKSMTDFNLPFEIAGIRPQGSWVKNTQVKPTIILQMMDQMNKDIVWIDADAEVKQVPSWLYHVDGDIAFHTIKVRNEMLTGTVYFKNNDKIRDFLRRWEKLNGENDKPDAVNFQKLLTGDTYLRKVDMPPEYVKIFDSDVMGDNAPVIVHNQASRRFKEAVDTGISPDNLTFTLLNSKRDQSDACTVVGNGPYQSDLSREIDNSFVMRCNNFKLRDSERKLGTRTDVNISSLYHEIVPQEKVDYPILGVLPISDNLYQEYTDAKEMHLHWSNNATKCINLGNEVWTYNDKDDYAKLFTEVAEEIKAFPTVGILAIATARKMGFGSIILIGFTFFQSDKSHYWSDIKVDPSSHHNVEAERILVRKWVEEEPTRYILDELMKEKLYANETVG